MALRLACKRFVSQQTFAFPTSLAKTVAIRSFAGAPAVSSDPNVPATVFDKMINLTIVDPSGARRKIKGMVGTSLYEACEFNEVELGPSSIGGPAQIVHTERWTEPVFGEGPTSGYDHVVLSGPGANTATPVTRSETRMIEDYWDFDEVFAESRLASMITLTKQMDGMIVYVPARVDDNHP